MKKYIILACIMLAASVVLGVISYLILPETVVTQFTANGSTATTMPKLVAILIPFALSAGGALVALFRKENATSGWKSLLVSAVGLAVFAIMLFVNL